MSAAVSSIPQLLALDWGTSSLRAFLMRDGNVTETRSSAHGIQHLPLPGVPGYEKAFAEIAGDWLKQWPTLPIVACGMVGSAQGWCEAPYVPCPADAAALASLLHCASLLVFPDQGGVAVPYTAVSILLLYAEMREARGRSLAQARSYRAVCEAEQPLAVYSHYDSEIDACNAVKCPLYDAGSFLTEIERPDTVDRFSLIYTPIALALAIILSLVASFNCGEPVRFFWAFSAILSVSAPIGLLCAFGASYKNTASRLLRSARSLSRKDANNYCAG